MKTLTPKLTVISAAQLLKRGEKYRGDLTYKCYKSRYTKYRYVKYVKKINVIEVSTGHGDVYEVDLDRCKTAGACLDWIHQLHEKTWFDAAREKEFIHLLFRLIPTKLWSGAA